MTQPEQDPDETTTGDADPADEASGDDATSPEDDEPTVASLREELLEEVQDATADQLADELAASRLTIENLREETEALTETVADKDAEIEDLTSRLKRKQADFQNFKKRMERKREEEKQRATEDLVSRLLDVRDNLRRALEQDDSEALRDGVASTLTQFETELDRENVEPIEPEPGDEVDPEHHEVLARIDADLPEDTIADVHRPGYVMAEKVLRPAQVAVSDGSDNETEAHDDTTNSSDQG
ncbi:nucleotide exchange factor GrpE [Halorhabdus salina]|uniref:nucleotide exchange factor GrpE n=1 Tax=Halorhabdus salina TaxID=2750670 RepID=UPI0015EFA153|nr:nucleotide exchange factor GrpE [Halorhabdus salina]